MDSKNYVKRKKQLEKDLDLLKDIKTAKTKEKHKVNIQKIFIKCMIERIDEIESVEQKKEALSLLNIIRYYNFIPFDENRFIGEVEELKEDIEILEGKMLLKLYEIKAIAQVSKDIQTDIGIIKPIFQTRIMNLKNVAIQAINQNNKIVVKIYDGDILEMEFTIENLNNVEFKKKKKIKLFGK